MYLCYVFLFGASLILITFFFFFLINDWRSWVTCIFQVCGACTVINTGKIWSSDWDFRNIWISQFLLLHYPNKLRAEVAIPVKVFLPDHLEHCKFWITALHIMIKLGTETEPFLLQTKFSFYIYYFTEHLNEGSCTLYEKEKLLKVFWK